jgi:16S rRNA (uracil1498-N3)-methyltransferase
MSRLPRFFISPEQVSGPYITVTHEDVRHIATVLRMKTGDHLLLCDGKGTEYTVKIDRVGRSEIKTEIVEKITKKIHSPLVTLGQGLPKSDKMEWIVQKATELGVSTIVPLVTERTIVKVRDEEKRLVRWRKICREAAMQSNRLDIPEVARIQALGDYIRTLDLPQAGQAGPGTLLILPWEEGTELIKTVLRGKPDVKNIIVLIGPEGGFSAAEAAMAQEKGFRAVSLGPNILRTETAAVAVLSMILYETSTNNQVPNLK